ncbi:43f4e832-c452-4bf8-8bbb-1e9b7cb97bd2 [Thermothielavioides terrestris]|uniref:43f4e832-c452-4bf8-8bbb-1e9b7cb97bd2 n=1 Tax=Thermothielavioides terrestris TaxID=2587410 RepID=A0A446BEA8_9PEZI|nr:43f4e832-c452-4bf8-8bbb-1e9b7cb97bd2 [Thermothielavioides terrestris]
MLFFQNQDFNQPGLAYADITFENIPCDQAILEIVHLPKDVGADTLWALGYEAYGSLSPIVQKLAESLAATHYQPNFARDAAGWINGVTECESEILKASGRETS